MQTEPKYITDIHRIGELNFTFKGEAWDNRVFLDTTVTCNDKFLCCITWADKETFVSELNAVIEKYRI